MTDRTPEQIAELMAPVCKALTEISARGRAFGLCREDGSGASIGFYLRIWKPWSAHLALKGARYVIAHGATPVEAVEALAAQVDASDPALNWKTLGVETAA